ncbi:prephenate dehydratase [Geotalea uraniireducens]|uniref:Bifunctional chorismate mutase/prephenate dehydratase n=1 Tax=Geotalea uraniireducens TaxID=351604 RepID=A0ABN6VWL9_9BACT|nr:prephenate dehydratase [Geotalea uraniireducens]BDV44117.1 prephenate dehydratase [Geotalea uraniireducens]
MSKTLADLRRDIDAIDDQILDLLNRRARCVIEVGRLKTGEKRDFHVPNREREIYERLTGANPGPFPNEAVRSVFREVISASLSLESPMKVAFLGPKATFSHLATLQQFGLSAELVPLKSISAVFEEVEKGRAYYGVVPVENSTEGVVSHTLDMFMDSELKINAEILLEVHHDLLSRTGRVEDIKKIYSHPQPIAQCRNWLEEHFPGVPLVDVASTAVAAQIAGEDYTAAAIASELAATMYDLKVVRKRIEDQVNNFTRFLVIGKKMAERCGDDKTSLMFLIKDEPGILYRMLEPFAKRGVSLSKIESRPLKKKAWEYIFFLDLAGHVSEPAVAEAVQELKGYCQFVKILGSYPRAK